MLPRAHPKPRSHPHRLVPSSCPHTTLRLTPCPPPSTPPRVRSQHALRGDASSQDSRQFGDGSFVIVEEPPRLVSEG